ncbi:hypothetical protein QVD17_26913 [Tagetes erecta]|uniref:Uncharacterized protein n=1 Tax=Tagetes erecta TaxID=13708 RepID=A0AAD8K880_TARER|nr:hypothetical protein QVD17_26913 [Tagetes erecta]
MRKYGIFHWQPWMCELFILLHVLAGIKFWLCMLLVMKWHHLFMKVKFDEDGVNDTVLEQSVHAIAIVYMKARMEINEQK